MSNRIFRSIKEPKRRGLSWKERWQGPDKGVITCWEVGRDLAEKEPTLADRAKSGELPPLGWKGGVQNKLKINKKYGTHYYLAQLQGLKGEDLDIDLDEDAEIVCARTKQRVIFTSDFNKYKNA